MIGVLLLLRVSFPVFVIDAYGRRVRRMIQKVVGAIRLGPALDVPHSNRKFFKRRWGWVGKRRMKLQKKFKKSAKNDC